MRKYYNSKGQEILEPNATGDCIVHVTEVEVTFEPDGDVDQVIEEGWYYRSDPSQLWQSPKNTKEGALEDLLDHMRNPSKKLKRLKLPSYQSLLDGTWKYKD